MRMKASLPVSNSFSMAIDWGLLAIGRAPFEIGFTVNAIVVWTGKYEVVGQ
jgi:hypothetical protein